MSDRYRADIAYIHDAGYGALARDAAQRLIEELADLGLQGTVVDVGCGSGIFAEALVEAGYRVVGFDLSGAMLDLARARTPRAEFQLGSFVSTPLAPCITVVAVGEVLCYAYDSTKGDRERADRFKRAYDALLPGGVLLFDVVSPDRASVSGTERTFTAEADWAILAESSAEPFSHMLVRRIISFRRVRTLFRRDEELHRLSIVDPTATLETLRNIGFEAERISAYHSLPLPPGLTAFLCRKPEGGRAPCPR